MNRFTYVAEMRPVQTAKGWVHPPQVHKRHHFPVASCNGEVSAEIAAYVVATGIQQNTGATLQAVATTATKSLGTVNVFRNCEVLGCFRGKQVTKNGNQRTVRGVLCFVLNYRGTRQLVFGDAPEFGFPGPQRA